MMSLLILLAWLCLAGNVALGHDLKAQFQIKEGTVTVLAYFSDGTAAGKASVNVLDSAKKRIQQGRTDGKGEWKFSIPQSGTYQVVIDAGAGHRKSFELTITEQQSIANPGLTKEEELRNRWLQMVWGLGVIGVLAVVMIIAVRVRKWISIWTLKEDIDTVTKTKSNPE